MDASWPSNKLVAVTRRILFLAENVSAPSVAPPPDGSLQDSEAADAVFVKGRLVKEWNRPSFYGIRLVEGVTSWVRLLICERCTLFVSLGAGTFRLNSRA